MATAHHSQNESYPLQLKIRSHETPATTDLSEPLMYQALYLYFFHPIKLFRSNPWFWPHPVAVLPVLYGKQASITMLLCSSLASPSSLGPSCHIHPEAYTTQLNWPSYPLQPKVTPTKNTAVVGGFNPIWKILVKWDHSPRLPGENQK